MGGRERGTRRFEEIETYLDLIGDDGTRTELCADLVCPDRIKVYETESLDVTVALDVLEIAQRGHITLIGVVLPIKLDGDWASKAMCVSWTDRPKEEGIVWEIRSDLEEVQLASAHARHALADCGFDGGTRNAVVAEYAPFGAAEDAVRWQLLLELPLLA
jgi:hypothetical protein